MNKKPLACVVLAAGQGSRMKSDTPKVLHELAGLPMIKWLLNTLGALSPEKIIVVTAPDAQALQAAAAPHTIAIQEIANGTGGALKAAVPALDGFEGDVLVVLGDAPLVTQRTLEDLIAARAGAGITVLGAVVDNPTGYGRLILDEHGVVQKIVEEKDATKKERQVNIINTGVFCINGKYLAGWLDQIGNDNAQGEYYLTDLPAIAAKDRKLTTTIATLDATEVQGCNTKLDLAVLENILQNRLRSEAMVGGVTMLDPSTVYLHHDTELTPGIVLEPNIYFGPGVRVEGGVRIKAFSHIEGAVISKNASVGPFARLRPEAVIGEGARIGNFVEVKKSTIGARSKIGHLAYVGDTDMGADVNFSAGAITVNYDGYDKHKTRIGDGAMIGSDVSLVAPVEIGAGAFIAAGSTITKNVQEDALAMARSDTETREGWSKRYRTVKEKKKQKS